jgi:hypothetical protein
MRSALGVDVRTGRVVRASEDGRVTDAAAEATTPDAIAVSVADDVAAEVVTRTLAELRSRFGMEVRTVGEEVARRYADDVAAGAALWALDETKKRPAVVPPVIPGTTPSVPDEPTSSMGDFADGQSMSDFADGQSMSDFADPTTMSDHGAGRSMSDFSDGREMSEFDDISPSEEPAAEPPPEPAAEPVPEAPVKRIPKGRLVAAAAVAVVVVVAAAVLVASAGTEEAPVAATATTTEPPPTTTTTALPAERTFDVTYTITSTNGDEFPDAPMKTGLTGPGRITLTCEGDSCRFDFNATDPTVRFAVDGVAFDGSSLNGAQQSTAPAEGLHGDCERQQTRSVTAAVSGGAISGDGSFTADPITCPGPERNTLHIYTFTFEGTEAALELAPQPAPAPPAAGA